MAEENKERIVQKDKQKYEGPCWWRCAYIYCHAILEEMEEPGLFGNEEQKISEQIRGSKMKVMLLTQYNFITRGHFWLKITTTATWDLGLLLLLLVNKFFSTVIYMLCIVQKNLISPWYWKCSFIVQKSISC